MTEMIEELESRMMTEHTTKMCYLLSHRKAQASAPASGGRVYEGAWERVRACCYLWTLMDFTIQEEEEGFYIGGCGGDTSVRMRYEASNVTVKRDGPDSWHVVTHGLPPCKFSEKDAARLTSDFRWYGCDSDNEVARDAVDKVREDLQDAIREGDEFSSRYLETLEYLVAADPKFPEKSAEEER